MPGALARSCRAHPRPRSAGRCPATDRTVRVFRARPVPAAPGRDQRRRMRSAYRHAPAGNGYGFVASREEPFPHATWRGVVVAEIGRSRRRIRDVRAGIIGTGIWAGEEGAGDFQTIDINITFGAAAGKSIEETDLSGRLTSAGVNH